MKKLLNLVLLLFVINVTILAQFQGQGTELDPYKIYKKEDLEKLSDLLKDDNTYNQFYNKHYKLMNNIRDSVRTVIGRNRWFEGVFNGQGFKITLAINQLDSVGLYFRGLFGCIKNAKLLNIVVDGYVKYIPFEQEDDIYGNRSFFTGAIVGRSFNSEIYNCVNFANVSINDVCIGGVVGHTDNSGNTQHCINLGSIKGCRQVGGIVGHSETQGPKTDKIVNCINSGLLEAGIDRVGGITARGDANNTPMLIPLINNCINTGVLISPSSEEIYGIGPDGK